MSRVERMSAWLRRRAGTRAGAIGLFAWAFAEALVWPIVPDAGLALLVAARPRRWPALSAATVAGSVAGGVAGFTAAAQQWAWPLPLTTGRMHAAVEGWLAGGAGGLAHQPLSGVPYKVFVAAAPDAGIELTDFVMGTLYYRAPRLIIVAVLTAGIAAFGWRLVPRDSQAVVHIGASVAAAAALLAGLALVVARWS